MEQVGQLVKDGTVTNSSGKKMYTYLSEEQTTAELQMAFIKHGLVMFPIKVEDEIIYLETIKENVLTKIPITKIRVTYKICDAETGEFEEIQSIGQGSDTQDKGSNKAMTGAFKYAQRQTFMISTGDDGDKVGSGVLDKEHSDSTQSTKPQEQRNTQSNTNTQYTQQTSNTANYSSRSTGEKATDPQVAMLRKKKDIKGVSYGDISQFLNRSIESMEDVLKSEVQVLVRFLDEYRKQAAV